MAGIRQARDVGPGVKGIPQVQLRPGVGDGGGWRDGAPIQRIQRIRATARQVQRAVVRGQATRARFAHPKLRRLAHPLKFQPALFWWGSLCLGW